MKKWMSMLCILAVALAMSGCGSSFQPSVSSLYIQKDGRLTQAIVESFEKDYYSLTEFESMINKEIDTYNRNYGEGEISLKQLELKDQTLYLELDFSDADVYSAYNEEYCFVGTVEEALEAGLSFQMDFKDADYEDYSGADVTAKKSQHVAVLQNEGIVQLQSPVKYVSNNVEILSDHIVQVMPISDNAEYAYVIY